MISRCRRCAGIAAAYRSRMAVRKVGDQAINEIGVIGRSESRISSSSTILV